MKINHLITLLFAIFISEISISQTEISEGVYVPNDNLEINGMILDYDTKAPLLYTNIYIFKDNRGTVSNELGHFSINVTGLAKTDTLRFQYVGYKTRKITLAELEADSVVYLKEEIISLNEFLVFASEPNADAIIKNVLKNKDANYRKTTGKKQTFIRFRDMSDINESNLDYKKSSIPELDRDVFDHASENIPKNTTSFTDFLCELYFSENDGKAINFKVNPIRMVELKEDDISEPGQIGKILEDALANTKENEYWKVKTGVFSKRVDEEELKNVNTTDSLGNNVQRLSHYTALLKEQFEFPQMDNKDEWEFLYSTGKYDYTLAGGTVVNGENVYIIDFTPKKNGLYQGRLFIAFNTYALIRADFEYAPDKTGSQFSLFGIGYTENQFSGSIYFEKTDDNYTMKYFSRQKGYNLRLERKISLQKKKERTLFDKKIDEIKMGFKIDADIVESIELLVLKDKAMTGQQYTDFKQPEFVKTIFVNQFNNKLWKDFDIIEPTEQMKDYKKHDAN